MSTNALTAVSGLPTKLNLVGLEPEALAEFFDGLGEKSYRAQQIMGWLYRRGVLDFQDMTDIGLRLRQRLEQVATLTLPEVIRVEESTDGTRKWLLDIGAGQAVETVFIPEANRNTLCISSQAGCVIDIATRCDQGSAMDTRTTTITSTTIYRKVVTPCASPGATWLPLV